MRLLRLCLAVALLAATAATASAAPASAAASTTPELAIMSLVNEARVARGLVPLRSDSRLWTLADERAAAMAVAGELSHSVGGSLQGGLQQGGIQWYGFGEVIAYTSGSAGGSAAALFELWASSPPHWTLLTSSTYNYLGVGLAISSSGLSYGSIVLTESRDRTGPRATIVKATVSGDDVRWTWRGSDPALQSHTAGLRDFTVQQRTDRGSWVTVSTNTKATARSATNRAGGHWYGLRVRARDGAGNLGSWSAELRVWVP
jgi:uncharacterized protein YkwD